jgi:Zn-dependent alcohol dehydrogenase
LALGATEVLNPVDVDAVTQIRALTRDAGNHKYSVICLQRAAAYSVPCDGERFHQGCITKPSELSERRREFALALGATEVLNPVDVDAVTQIRALTSICTRVPCQGTYLRNRIHINGIKDLGGTQGQGKFTVFGCVGRWSSFPCGNIGLLSILLLLCSRRRMS